MRPICAGVGELDPQVPRDRHHGRALGGDPQQDERVAAAAGHPGVAVRVQLGPGVGADQQVVRRVAGDGIQDAVEIDPLDAVVGAVGPHEDAGDERCEQERDHEQPPLAEPRRRGRCAGGPGRDGAARLGCAGLGCAGLAGWGGRCGAGSARRGGAGGPGVARPRDAGGAPSGAGTKNWRRGSAGVALVARVGSSPVGGSWGGAIVGHLGAPRRRIGVPGTRSVGPRLCRRPMRSRGRAVQRSAERPDPRGQRVRHRVPLAG